MAVQMYSPESLESTPAMSRTTNPKSEMGLILLESWRGRPLNFHSMRRLGSLAGLTRHSKWADIPSRRLLMSYKIHIIQG